MKKFIALILALILALSLAACSNGNGGAPADDAQSAEGAEINPPDTQGADTAPDGGGETGQAAASLIKWMMDGTFSYDYTMISEGPEGKTEGTGSMAMDGDKMAMSTEMTIDGTPIKSRIIKLGETTYIIDDASKSIMEMSGGASAEGVIGDYSKITLTGSGTGEINGKTLPYEDYTENDTGATVRYYLENGDVYGIETNIDGYKTIMIITSQSDSAPSGVFDLPTDYTEMGHFNSGGRDNPENRPPADSGGRDNPENRPPADSGDRGNPENRPPDGVEMPDFDLPDFDLPDGVSLP